MNTETKVLWFDVPEAHDYPAALSYLNLIYDDATAKKLVGKLKSARVVQFKSKDIFRASGLSLLGTSNLHVARSQKKIRGGEKLSPLLLVRAPAIGRVIVADGYHRLCAVYSFDEDAIIPCQIV
jgi:hypothetical protein